MAKGKKTGGKNWAPGQSGNPRGSFVIPKEIRDARKLNRLEFEAAANKYLFMTRDDLLRAWKAPETSVLDVMVIALINRGIVKGDLRSLGFMLDRLVGPVNQFHILASAETLSQSTQGPITLQELRHAIESDGFIALKEDIIDAEIIRGTPNASRREELESLGAVPPKPDHPRHGPGSDPSDVERSPGESAGVERIPTGDPFTGDQD